MVPPTPPFADAQRPAPAGRLTVGERNRLQTWFLGILAFATVMVMLVQARFILVSLVFAIILFSLTTDAINSIARLKIGTWRITNWLASVVAFALIAGGLITLTSFIVGQVNTVVTQTIAFSDQAIAAIGRMAASLGPDAEAAVVASIRSVDLSGWLRTAAGQAGNLVSGAVLVILFVGFLFGERLFFGTKLEHLMGDAAKAARISRIIRSIIRRINHYLIVKTLVSVVTALAVWLVMVGFGLEFAGAMAILTFVFNYIPSVGSILATIIVALVAYLQVPEPSFGVLILVIVGMIQFILGSVIDPMLMGRALRVSAFGIIISLAFWGFVWGVPGAFLAVPILVTTMIVCSHIPAARPVAILISREGLPEFDDDEPAAQPQRRAAE
jgi:predicted PurR-regulated permease PerM